MTEKTISLTNIEPIELYGINNENIKIIKSFFPSLKIIERGYEIKIIGDSQAIRLFEKKLNHIISYYHQYSSLNEGIIQKIIETDADNEFFDFLDIERSARPSGGNSNDHHKNNDEILLYGVSGKPIKAITPNQRRLVRSIKKNDLVFAIGVAGTGKTYTAVALAVRAFKNKEVKRIILTRPAVEAGENLGFLPGDLKEKLDPYLQPLYDALYDMIPAQKLATYLEDRTIEIAPLAFMRGRTLDNAFAILDEAQNATTMQLKMFITRMGRTAKFVVTGDVTQIDLPPNHPSGLLQAEKLLNSIKGIGFVYLDERDIVRHDLVQKIVRAYEHENNRTEEEKRSDRKTETGKD